MDNTKELEWLITPVIFHGPGCCPICGSNLILSECERNVFLLNNDGSVNRFIEDTEVICTAKCFTCNKRYAMIRSHGVYRHYSPAAEMFADMDYKENEKRAKGKYKINGNPLCD